MKSATGFSIQTFSDSDLEIHRRQIRKLWLNLAISILVLGGIYGILIFSFEELRPHYRFAMIPFCIPLVFFLGFSVLKFIKLSKDNREQQKICGEFPADPFFVGGQKNNRFALRISCNNTTRRIYISESAYDQIKSGRNLYVEYSQYACTVFMLKQGSREIQPYK